MKIAENSLRSNLEKNNPKIICNSLGYSENYNEVVIDDLLICDGIIHLINIFGNVKASCEIKDNGNSCEYVLKEVEK